MCLLLDHPPHAFASLQLLFAMCPGCRSSRGAAAAAAGCVASAAGGGHTRRHPLNGRPPQQGGRPATRADYQGARHFGGAACSFRSEGCCFVTCQGDCFQLAAVGFILRKPLDSGSGFVPDLNGLRGCRHVV